MINQAHARWRQAKEHLMTDDIVHRFLGGPPLTVLLRLALLSILVGVVLAAIGFDPWNIIHSIQRLLNTIWNMGWDAVSWLWRYFLLGAVLVIPIWLITRLIRVPSERRRDPTRTQ
jgi:hypothetical protein